MKILFLLFAILIIQATVQTTANAVELIHPERLMAAVDTMSDSSSVGSTAKYPVKEPIETENYKLNGYNEWYDLKRFSGVVTAETYSQIDSPYAAKRRDGETDYSAKLSYKINDRTSLQAYYEFDSLNGWNGNTAQPYNKASWLGSQDIYLGLARSNLFPNSSGYVFDTQARIYVPNSPDSADREQIAQVRFYGTVSKEFARGLRGTLVTSPRFFIQQQDTYQNVNNVTKSTDAFRLHTFSTLRYAFNDKFAIEQELGVYQMWFYGTGISHRPSGARADYLDVGTSVIYLPIKAVYLQAGIRQSKYGTDLTGGDGRKTANGIYADDQAEYFLITSISI